MKRIFFRVGDILETPGHLHPRLYSIESVLLGATSHEDLLELSCIDRSKGSDADGKKLGVIHVPQEMVEAGLDSGLFNLTRAE